METTATTDAAVGRVRLVVFGVSAGLLGLMTLAMLVPNVLPPLFRDPGGVHFIHDVAFVMFAVMLVAGVAAQLRSPRRRPAAILASLGFPVAILVLGLPVGFLFPPVVVFLVLAVVGTATHPARRDLLRPTGPTSTPMLALAVVGLVGAAPYAWEQLAIHRALLPTDPHSEFGHWVGMAAIALLAPIFLAIASRRPGGWPVVAGLGAASAIAVGAASVVYPQLPSSLGATWGAVAVAWGVLAIVAAATGAGTARASEG